MPCGLKLIITVCTVWIFCGYDEVRDLEEGRDIVIDELGNFFKYNYGVSLEGFNMTSDDLGGI